MRIFSNEIPEQIEFDTFIFSSCTIFKQNRRENINIFSSKEIQRNKNHSKNKLP